MAGNFCGVVGTPSDSRGWGCVKTDLETMYKYLETFLGESTRTIWESYKTNFRENYNSVLKLGANPYNCVNQISSLITGEDPNSRNIM